MPKIRFKDINIYYSQQGEGPAVVLLHGFLEGSWMWKDIVPELKKRHRVVCIDLPGHGKSDCIGYVHTMDEMAEAVKAVLKHLKLRRVSMIGHSMGGYVALAYAEYHPDDLKALVLYQSTARADSPLKQNDRVRTIKLVQQNYKSFIRQSVPMLFRPVNRKKYREEVNWVKDKALETPLQGVIAALGGMKDRPNRELLLKFPPYPVHIIAGDKDPRIPYQEASELSEISDQVTLHTIKGCGHMSYVEDLPKTISLIQEVLKSVN